jgi:hypothetical protein
MKGRGLAISNSVFSYYFVYANIFEGLERALDNLRSVDTSTSGVLEGQLSYIEENIPGFHNFFEILVEVMSSAEKKERVLPESPKTPNQPTIKPNPNFTNSSTGSGTSSQGKPEESVKLLVNALLKRVLAVMSDNYKTIPWCDNKKIKLVLTSKFVPGSLSLMTKIVETDEIRSRYREYLCDKRWIGCA